MAKRTLATLQAEIAELLAANPELADAPVVHMIDNFAGLEAGEGVGYKMTLGVTTEDYKGTSVVKIF